MLLNLSPYQSISFSGSECLIMLCLTPVFLISLMYGIHWAYLGGSLNLWFSQTWATSPNMFFLSLHLSHSFRDSNYRYIKLLEVVPEVTGSMLTFSPMIILFSVSFWIISITTLLWSVILCLCVWVQCQICYWSHSVHYVLEIIGFYLQSFYFVLLYVFHVSR